MTTTQPLHYADRKPSQPQAFQADRPLIRGFVNAFYQRVRGDEMIGPIFARVIADESWPEHLETMTDFWSAVAFSGPSFRGNPMVKHARIRDLAPEHFERWLAIFESAATAYWPQDVAALLTYRAQQIAPALLRAVARAHEQQMVTETDLH